MSSALLHYEVSDPSENLTHGLMPLCADRGTLSCALYSEECKSPELAEQLLEFPGMKTSYSDQAGMLGMW